MVRRLSKDDVIGGARGISALAKVGANRTMSAGGRVATICSSVVQIGHGAISGLPGTPWSGFAGFNGAAPRQRRRAVRRSGVALSIAWGKGYRR